MRETRECLPATLNVHIRTCIVWICTHGIYAGSASMLEFEVIRAYAIMSNTYAGTITHHRD